MPFEVPRGAELAARLASVLEVIYLIFNEGYSATAGDDWMRPALCEEALRLGRILAGLAPTEPEVHGLVALMEIQASRSRARTGPDGRADPAARAEPRALGSAADPPRPRRARARRARCGGARGPYALQAAIAACHARARTADETDWARIAALYDALGRARAVARRRAQSRGGGGDGVRPGGRPGARRRAGVGAGAARPTTCCRACAATCSHKLGRLDEARAEFERAASLTRNERERELLLDRVTALRKK